MEMLLNKFNADTSLANAKKVVVYGNKHPMSRCVLNAQQNALLSYAHEIVAAAWAGVTA